MLSGWRLYITLLYSALPPKRRRVGMRKARPTITESAAE
jgi:hypothetical protein